MASVSHQSQEAVVGDDVARAILIRAFEERLLKLFSDGRLFGTVHTCIGQEFVGVAVARHLCDGDLVFSNHRCHGHYLARTGDVEGLMAEIMGRATGICGGRGGSQHICAGGVFSNGVQGGIAPVSAGMALAEKLRQSRNIVVTFIGDGTLGEGVLYETLNIASKWNLPQLIVLENNRYAQSTSQPETLAGDICRRAEAFGIQTWHADTWAHERLSAVMGDAIAQVREECRPCFVRVDTYRLMAHSKGDDDRSKDEVRGYWARDPLTRFDEEEAEISAAMRSSADEMISRAVERALEAPLAYSPPQERTAAAPCNWQRTEIAGNDRVVTRIYQALREGMERDSRMFLLGEDIEGPYGGAFKVTKDLSLLFPGRVRNTPISEAALVGIANGLALNGMRPVCEIMFGDFLALAADQIINHAAKFEWMYNGQVSVPMIIRTPMGGKRGYGATHSQSLEKHFLGIPGTRVVALHHRYDPYALYRSLFASIDRPTLVIENKILYGEYVSHKTLAGFWCEHTDETYPTTRIRSSAAPDVTIVCYGGMLPDVEKAVDRLFEEQEIVAEVVCPTQIYPLRIDPILESVKASRRLLVVEEGQGFCGFGAEVLAAIHEGLVDGPIRSRRLSARAHPLPSCKPAELESLPGPDSIFHAAAEMVCD
jgi:2-oxoisovalerate dehydrogenase E1 component